MTEEINEPPVPEALQNVDPAKLAALRAKLKAMAGVEEAAPTESPAAESEKKGSTEDGKDVDWSEYDLPYETRHLYPQSRLRQTPQGPKWVVMLDEFWSADRSVGNYGQKVNDPKTGEKTDPLNLGEWLSDMLNAPEGWRPVSILPSGPGHVSVLLQRQYPFALTDPVLLKKPGEVVTPPTDPELARVEADAMKFMESEGLTPEPFVEESETFVEEPETFNTLEEQALALNPKTEYDPVLGPVVRPDAIGRIKAEVVDFIGPEPPETV